MQPLVVCVSGSRHWRDETHGDCVASALLAVHERFNTTTPPRPMVLVHGDCPGVDRIAAHRAQCLWPQVVIRVMPAPWRDKGRAAGPWRNTQMILQHQPDVLVFCHDKLKESKGTADCHRQAQQFQACAAQACVCDVSDETASTRRSLFHAVYGSKRPRVFVYPKIMRTTSAKKRKRHSADKDIQPPAAKRRRTGDVTDL